MEKRKERRELRQMKCWHCKSELIWNADFDYKDYRLDGDGVISALSCTNQNCGSYVEVYLKCEE